MHAPEEGRLGEGPLLSRINSRGRRGARRRTEGGERTPAAGAGREEGLRHAPGQVAGDPSASETQSGCGAELTAGSERRSHVPSSSLRPRAQGKEGSWVQPFSERGPAGVPGAVRRPQAITFSLPRPFRVSSASRSSRRAALRDSGPSASPTFTPRPVGPLPPSFSHFPHPPGSSRNPVPRALGEEAGLPPSPGVGRKHRHPPPQGAMIFRLKYHSSFPSVTILTL